jgi:hypothetical protein
MEGYFGLLKEELMTTSKKVIRATIALCIFSAWPLLAHEDNMSAPKPTSAEFNQVKQLAGTWSGTATHPGSKEKPEPVKVEFQVTSAGSAIEETLMQGTPHEMVDMYTDENGKLAMTHYCAMGNHPHLVLKQATPKAIGLEMGPTPGIDSAKDPHMHGLALEFPDADHLTERWTSYHDGKPGEVVVFNMTRVP